jgi:long-chain acyl-CoA synthetase
MINSPSNTILGNFLYWENTTPDNLFSRQPFGDHTHDLTYREAGNTARKIAAYLRSLDLPANSHIGILSKNCAEWIITDIAIMMSGHVSIPFYPTLTADQLHQVLQHSECSVLFVGKLDNWQAMQSGVPADVSCISFPVYNPDKNHIQWMDILSSQEPLTELFVPKKNDLFTIIYTSGTTGNPKGVMLTYGCFSSFVNVLLEFIEPEKEQARFFSYLPLCHIAERGYLENAAFAMGGVFYFAESLDTFSKNLAAARPTLFGSVPRIWNKFQSAILEKMPQQKMDLLLRLPLVGNIVKTKIRKALGLYDAKVILVGAAPMPVHLLKWFHRLGFNILEVYGMTENTGAVCITPLNKVKYGSAGKIHSPVELKINEDSGEICMKAEWNMLGYFKEPDMTHEVIDEEGWLHTGDVGEVDEDGYLYITGRVKDMYKTSKGEYVAPAQIESGFSNNSFVDQICVVGQGLPQPVALVVLSEKAGSLADQKVEESLIHTVNSLNPTLKPYERIRKVVIVSNSWTVENNMMTPTLKLKRNIIEKQYGPSLEDWFEREQIVIWEKKIE